MQVSRNNLSLSVNLINIPFRDCALDDSCVICSRCFHATKHADHNVSFFIAQQSGGSCDCGNEEPWRVPLNCPFHPPSVKPEPTADFILSTPKSGVKTFYNDLPPVQDFPHRGFIPPDLREMMHRTVGFALDFMLDTLDYSPDEPSVPTNEADLRLQPSADPMMKDQYCIVLWNDDKHSFDEVITLLHDMTNRSHEEASIVAHQIDENGREIIDMNTNVNRLLETAQAITQIDLGVTIRRAYDTFCEQVVGVIIEWLVDLTRSRLGMDTLAIREVITAELLSPRRGGIAGKHINSQSPLSLADVPNPARIDAMFLYHTRLWKKLRLSLKEVYTSAISLSHNHKLAIGAYGMLNNATNTN